MTLKCWFKTFVDEWRAGAFASVSAGELVRDAEKRAVAAIRVQVHDLATAGDLRSKEAKPQFSAASRREANPVAEV